MAQLGRGKRRSSPATLGTTVVAGTVAVMTLVLTGGVSRAEEPASTVPPVAEVDGTLVAVGQPPVPPTDPTDPTDTAPEPEQGGDVEVGLPPVPSFTVPDAMRLALW